MSNRIEGLFIGHTVNTAMNVQINLCPDKEHKEKARKLSWEEKRMVSQLVIEMFAEEVERAEDEGAAYRSMMRPRELAKRNADA